MYAAHCVHGIHLFPYNQMLLDIQLEQINLFIVYPAVGHVELCCCTVNVAKYERH